jgi:hypothetical protein
VACTVKRTERKSRFGAKLVYKNCRATLVLAGVNLMTTPIIIVVNGHHVEIYVFEQ